MSQNSAFRTVGFPVLTALLFAALAMAPVEPVPVQAASGTPAIETSCVINFIGHETTQERTRVILHATSPIDYRGGSLQGDQVILDLANVRATLPTPVVEIGAPEVDRAVIGPEVNRDGGTILKVRLTGVKARSHKVQTKGNELHVDLMALEGSRDEGLPKLIDDSSDVMAQATGPAGAIGEPEVKFVKAAPLELHEETASATETKPIRPTAKRVVAVAAGEPIVTKAEPESKDEKPMPEVVEKQAEAPQAEVIPAIQRLDNRAEPQDLRAAAAREFEAPAGNAMATNGSMTAGQMPFMAMAAAQDEPAARVLQVAVGRSLTVDTGVAIRRVSMSNPAVAEPVAISPTQLLINGLKPGNVTLVLWPEHGSAIVYELIVQIDGHALSQQMNAIFPGEKVRVQTSKDTIVLSGPVSGSDVAGKLIKLAEDFSPKVVDHMISPGDSRRQVMLKVRFAEVSKNALTELGAVLHHVDPEAPFSSDRGSTGTGLFSPPTGNLITSPVGPDLDWSDAINLAFFEKSIDLGLFITALKERGLFEELAEPTLLAADGQPATFLAGGEFPVPVAQPGAGFTTITIEWKKFGISLEFTPTIHNSGVIVMKVKPEVSALDFANGVRIEGFQIPAVTVRRAETEIELRDGQSFAIAGLYDRNLIQTKSKIPILGDIPLLGRLFRSKGLIKEQTELLVLVTPSIVEPFGPGEEPSLEMPVPLDLDEDEEPAAE